VDNPENLPRTQESKERTQKTQEFEPQGSVLRNESRRGTVVVEGKVEPERAELDLAVAEAQARGEIEANIGIRIVELVASAIDPEIVHVLQTIDVCQDHDADRERAEAGLARQEDLTSTTDGTSTMTDAELGSYHEDVVILLLVAELLEHGRRLHRLTQTLIVDLAVGVVVELAALLLDRIEHLLHGFAVGRRERLPLRDGEPSFGRLRHIAFRELLEGVADTREDLAQHVALPRDRLGLAVTGEVTVVRFDLLVLELVGDRQILERGESGRADGLGEFVAVFDDALCAGVVETELTENLLDGVGAKPVDLTSRCHCCLSNRVHRVISFNVPDSP
jgi:hypothetical protein